MPNENLIFLKKTSINNGRRVWQRPYTKL